MRELEQSKIKQQDRQAATINEGSTLGSTRHAKVALMLLFLAYALSITDRMILSVLLEPIRLEFGASDTQMGLLGGLSFALFYATLGLPIARLADRKERRLIIVFSLGLFSLMTATSGVATSFLMLFLFRIGVGIGEAGVNPASQSIIADYYPSDRRGTAMSILAVGAPVGMFVGYIIGGVVSEAFGWRAAMFVVGLPGLFLCAAIYFMLKEPVRGAMDDKAIETTRAPGILGGAGFMLQTPALRQLLIASTITGMVTYGNSTWLPTFFVRNHGLSQGEVGLFMALIFGILGAIGTLAGGRFFDILSKKGHHRGVWMIAMVKLATVPFFVAALLTESFALAVSLILIPALLGNVFLGPTLALFQTLSPVSMRAVAAAIKMFCLNLVGLGLGPLLVGIFSDLLKPTFEERSVAIALALMASLNIWSAYHFWLCGKAIKQANETKTP